MNTLQVITETEAVFIPEIQEMYELTEEEIEEGRITDFFDCDPDYFNWGDIRRMPVVETCGYIVVPDTEKPLSLKCEDMLLSFYDETKKMSEKPEWEEVVSTWDNFHSLNYGIAYRGGKGYHYGIWKYNARKKIKGA